MMKAIRRTQTPSGRPIIKGTKAKAAGKRELALPFDQFTAELISGADTFIDEMPDLAKLEDALTGHPEAFLADSASLVKTATKRKKIQALAFAYYVWIKSSRNPVFQRFVKEAWGTAYLKGRRLTKDTTVLHVIVEALIEYGEDEQAEANSKRRLYSRDVQAIRNLCTAGILPGNVVALAERAGEGIDKWSRNTSPALLAAGALNAEGIHSFQRQGAALVNESAQQESAASNQKTDGTIVQIKWKAHGKIHDFYFPSNAEWIEKLDPIFKKISQLHRLAQSCVTQAVVREDNEQDAGEVRDAALPQV